jgi:hypothetical protein
MKKDDYLVGMMQVPPKQRVAIQPFDERTQREAFTVTLEGLKGVSPDFSIRISQVFQLLLVQHQRPRWRIRPSKRGQEEAGSYLNFWCHRATHPFNNRRKNSSASPRQACLHPRVPRPLQPTHPHLLLALHKQRPPAHRSFVQTADRRLRCHLPLSPQPLLAPVRQRPACHVQAHPHPSHRRRRQHPLQHHPHQWSRRHPRRWLRHPRARYPVPRRPYTLYLRVRSVRPSSPLVG